MTTKAKMKVIITSLAAALCPLFAMSQTEPADTVSAHELHEVVIQAPKVIRKADMDVYHPSKSAVENSINGMQLLNNLMIPALTVNDALGTIQASGESVQVRINGRESTIEQVRALLPETIRRVEWIDNPGLRYGAANHVVNFIVDNPTTGGSFMASAMPALNVAWGNYMADVKLNSGRSQWEVGANFKLTNKISAYRDYTETFTYPDGSSLTRDETPRGGSLDNSSLGAWISYNYVKPDTTVFIAEINLNRNLTDKWLYRGILKLSDGSDDILLTDSHGNKGQTPSLSLYLQQSIGHGQMIIANFSGSFYFGRSYSDYQERLNNATDYLTDIHTNIRDRNQAYALETDYIRNWRNGRLTAGASYTANRNRSKYENLGGEIFHQRQDKVYLFAEYFHRFGKWTATAGIGVQYTDFLFKESGSGTHSWNPRPQATITYSLNQNHSFRLNFATWQSAPSLAETNIVPQQLDGFQWRIGNQSLKTSSSYMLTLNYTFNLPRLSGKFGVRSFMSPDAITPLFYWQDDRLITTYENSRGLRNICFFLAPECEIIPDWFSASAYLMYTAEQMRGTGYTHYNHAWSGNAQIQLMHWGFSLTAQYQHSQRDIWGEEISWGEDITLVDLSYNWKSWQFSAGILMPFGRYDQGSKSLNRWNRNEQHMRLNMRMPYVTIAYNFQWGRQKHEAQKIVDIDANADRSKAGGR